MENLCGTPIGTEDNLMFSVKYNYYSGLLYLILLFIPVNLLKDLFPIPVTLILGGIILLNIIMILKSRMSKELILKLVLPVIIFILNLFVTDDISIHFRYFFNWYSLLGVLLLCSNSAIMDALTYRYEQNGKKLDRLARISLITVCVLLFIPACYTGGWWGLRGGFTAFTVSHAVAAAMVALIVMRLLSSDKRHKTVVDFIYFLIIAYVVLQTGARTYVISLTAIVLYYVLDRVKSSKTKIMIGVALLFFIAYIMPSSSFAEKNEIVLGYQTVNNESFWDAFTSGRTRIWRIDLLYYLKSDWSHILLGGGYAHSFFINRNYYGMDIFAHNIFLETLLSSGIICFTILLQSMYRVFKVNCREKHSALTLCIYMVLIGFINGLFDSQLYCLSIIFLCILFRRGRGSNSREFCLNTCIKNEDL